jgi:hypothetical protein
MSFRGAARSAPVVAIARRIACSAARVSIRGIELLLSSAIQGVELGHESLFDKIANWLHIVFPR